MLNVCPGGMIMAILTINIVQRSLILLLLLVAVGACKPRSGSSDSVQIQSVEQINSMQKITSGEHVGEFLVQCQNGATEIVSADQIRQNKVCPAVTIDLMSCQYTGKQFVIRYKDQLYTQSVNEGVSSRELVCGERLSAMYDHDDLIVFDSQTKQFATINVDNQVGNVQLKIDGSLVLFYDQDDLFIYDLKSGGFATQTVDDNIVNVAIAMNKNGALVYDQDDIFYYCSAQQSTWQTARAEDNQATQVEENDKWLQVIVAGEIFALDTQTCNFTHDG